MKKHLKNYIGDVEMSRLLRNALQTPDGTILESKTRHDYKEYEDANGWVYVVDGGLDYIRSTVNKNAPATDLSLTEDMPHFMVRDHVTWGTYGKQQDQPMSYVSIAEMSDSHLTACLRSQSRMYPQVRDLMQAEIEYREQEKLEMDILL